jgi:TusA-related sulfurtransferase
MAVASRERAMDQATYFIDITGDVCPLTFVKTKLLLERMPVGAVATVRLKGVQPLDNVPRSVRAHGHEVISLEPETGEADPRQPYILTIRRC